MAWNKYYIFVRNPKITDPSEILSRLRLGDLEQKRVVPLHLTNKPKNLFMGFFGDSLWIVHPDLPFHFFSDEQTNAEKMFIELFPESEIAVLVENSTVNLFGYAIIDRGKKIRMKDGADGQIFHDFGEPLPEEKEIFERPIFDDEEIEEMRESGMTNEEIDFQIKFEASWRVPNLITRRFLGEPVGEIDTDKITLIEYE